MYPVGAVERFWCFKVQFDFNHHTAKKCSLIFDDLVRDLNSIDVVCMQYKPYNDECHVNVRHLVHTCRTKGVSVSNHWSPVVA